MDTLAVVLIPTADFHGSARLSLMTSRTRSPDPNRPAGGFFGRRRGRSLRPGRQRLLDYYLPELRLPLPAQVGGSTGPHIGLQEHFPPGLTAIWLEIGFGSGEHLAWQAETHPDVGFLGCELYVNGIASLVRHVSERGLANIRISDVEAMMLLQALPDASISRAFLLFPDPWPKRRHDKRRFVQAASLAEFARVLVDSAELRFATDDGPYARWTLTRVLAHPAFDWPAEVPDDWRRRPADWPETRYGAAARRAGGCPVYFTFCRRPRPAR